MKLRYQVHRDTREIFWKAQHDCSYWDQIDASAAYTAVYNGEQLTPEFIGSVTKVANDYTDDPGIRSIRLALEHALETVHRTLKDEAGDFYVHIIIYCDTIKGLQLMRKAVESEGPENILIWSGRPKPYPAVLEQTFMVHQKIEHMLRQNRVKFHLQVSGWQHTAFLRPEGPRREVQGDPGSDAGTVLCQPPVEPG